MRRALRVPGFGPLALSYAVNGLGDAIGVVALAVLVLDQTGSALATTALFLAAKSLPAVLAPAVTAGLDRRAVGKVVPAVYVLEAGAFAGLASLATAFWLPGVLALAVADGVLALTARGLTRGAVATVLGPQDALRDGNAVLNLVFAVTSAAGPLLGGLILHLTDARTALWIDAGTFLVAAAVLASARRVLPVARQTAEGWLERARDGLRHIGSQASAARLVAGEGVAIVFFTMVVPVSVVFVKEELNSSSVGYGLLLGAWGLGALLGSIFFARRPDLPLGAAVLGSTLAVGAGYLATAASPILAVACLASVVGGFGNGIQWVAVMTAVQDATEEAYQARVAGLLESVAAFAPAVGFLIGGAVTALVSARLAYALAGAGAVAVAAVWARGPLLARRAVA